MYLKKEKKKARHLLSTLGLSVLSLWLITLPLDIFPDCCSPGRCPCQMGPHLLSTPFFLGQIRMQLQSITGCFQLLMRCRLPDDGALQKPSATKNI